MTTSLKKKTKVSQEEFRVLLVMSMRVLAHWEVLRGVNTFARENQLPWTVRIYDFRHWQRLEAYIRWKPDIVLTQGIGPEHVKFDTDSVVVAMYPGLDPLTPFYCGYDDEAVGRMAAHHFLERRFRRFAYATPVTTDSENVSSRLREKGFNEVLRAEGFTCEVLKDENLLGPTSIIPAEKTIRFFKRQKQSMQLEPMGVFCFNDSAAYTVVDSSRSQAIVVPDSMAVLGVDGNTSICEAISPRISSIPFNHFHHGYKSGEMAQRLFEEGVVEEKSVFLSPDPVVVRESTDVLMVGDETIANALHYLRKNLRENVKVSNLVQASGVSRSLFEERFRKAMDCSPLEYIHRQRIRLVGADLMETNSSLVEIAERTGFPDPYHLHKLFKKITGQTPGQFRKRRE